MALLFPRPVELRLAEWTEFDFERAVWTIPAKRMKMRHPHQIPLSHQSISALAALRPLGPSNGLVFPGFRVATRPMSENTLNAALRRMGYSQHEMTAHGFRATASTLLNESGLWSADAIERQLAHIEQNDVRRAYARGEHWEERVRMMAWWADHLDALCAGSPVTPRDRRAAPEAYWSATCPPKSSAAPRLRAAKAEAGGPVRAAGVRSPRRL
jgi:integrase